MLRTNHLLFVLAASLLFHACKGKPAANSASANGIWQSDSSGWILQIRDSLEYRFYDQTSISCTPFREGPFSDLTRDLRVSSDSLHLKKGVITHKFTRLRQLPPICSVPVRPEKAGDPMYNFEVFAENVREHYAFMGRNGIDWPMLYAKQRAKISQETTDAGLFRLISETLSLLNDNHAYLEAPGADFQDYEPPLDTESEATEKELPEYGDFQVAQLVASHHLEQEMTEESWLVQWGRLNDSIGYMQVKAMWLYADLEIPQSQIDELGFVDAYIRASESYYEGDYIRKEVAGAAKILDRAMSDLEDTSSLVIDIRFNGGGQDAVSFEILSRFLSDTLEVASQQLKSGKDTFTYPQRLGIQGVSLPYTKPVYILTSRQTGSAAEAFVIASMARENAWRIGTATSGALSTALEKTLPNGWIYSISNEVYMDTVGTSYEYTGVPVDYHLDYSDDRQVFFRDVVNNLQKDREQILRAIEQTGNR